MNLFRLAVLSVGLGPVLPLASAAQFATPVTASPDRVVGYLASWAVGTRGTVIANLPAGQLTHISTPSRILRATGR